MKSPFILSIDGNIGSGKSTLYADLQTYYKDNTDICFCPEPVDTWTKIVDNNNTPILTNLYKDTKRFAFRFQMMAYISRLHLLRKKVKENKYKIIITERSVQTDRNVFAKMLFDDGMIELDEYTIYNNWFNEFLDEICLGGIIYVKAEPEICDVRVKCRAREGEIIPLDYLKKCHEYHEDWLQNIDNKMIIEANVDTKLNENIHIRDKWITNINTWIYQQINNSKKNEIINETIDNIIDDIAIDQKMFPILQFDGACRGNPSNLLGLGCVITNNGEISCMNKKCIEIRSGTNNEAEYYALIEGLKMALENEFQCIHVEGDSKLIINQMIGIYKVKAENLLPLHNEAMTLAKQFRIIKFNHIKRDLNKQADKLANQALDTYDIPL